MLFTEPVKGYVLSEISAVCHCKPESPMVFQNGVQLWIAESGDAVYLVVCSHYTPCSTVFYGIHEGGIIILIFQSCGKVCIAAPTVMLVVVCTEVLQCGDRLIVSIFLPCHCTGIGCCHLSCKENVLAIGLLSSSPAWVTLHVDGRSPYTECALFILIVIGSALISGYFTYLFHEFCVKGTCQSNRLREYC